MRQIILNVDGIKAVYAGTDFTTDDLQNVADEIQSELSRSEDGWNDEKVIEEMVKRGYLKLGDDAPEIVDLYII